MLFFTANQLVAHAAGDYLTQSHWVANNKTKKKLAALIHVVLYGVPFLFLTHSIPALVVITGTHFVIDHWRLARHVIWLKNFVGPTHSNPPWSECKDNFGFPPETPIWMSFWLMVIVDNLLHVLINGAALHWLG